MKEKFQTVNVTSCDVTNATNVVHITTKRDTAFTVDLCVTGSYNIEILTKKNIVLTAN